MYKIITFSVIIIFFTGIYNGNANDINNSASKIIKEDKKDIEFRELLKKFKDIREQKSKRTSVELDDQEFTLAKEIFQSVKKGLTTERDVLEWFGQPHWKTTFSTVSEFVAGWTQYIQRDGYPKPKANQEVLGYKYYHQPIKDATKLNRGYNTMALLITINKSTTLVEECQIFDESGYEAIYD